MGVFCKHVYLLRICTFHTWDKTMSVRAGQIVLTRISKRITPIEFLISNAKKGQWSWGRIAAHLECLVHSRDFWVLACTIMMNLWFGEFTWHYCCKQTPMKSDKPRQWIGRHEWSDYFQKLYHGTKRQMIEDWKDFLEDKNKHWLERFVIYNQNQKR